MLASQYHSLPLPMDIVICNFRTAPVGIHWLWSERTVHDIDDYKRLINYVVLQMDSGKHFRRSLYPFHTPCSWCDVISACEDMKHIETIDGLMEFASLGGNNEAFTY